MRLGKRTVHDELVADSARAVQSRMPHQTVQPTAVHAAQRVQGKLRGHDPVLSAPVLRLPGNFRVPGQAWRRVSDRTTGGSHTERLPFLQDHGIQRGDRQT